MTSSENAAFNQIFRLDAISEVSRETSISQVASYSDVDNSMASTTAEDVRMTSLLGPSQSSGTANNNAEKQQDESFEFAPQTVVQEEAKSVVAANDNLVVVEEEQANADTDTANEASSPKDVDSGDEEIGMMQPASPSVKKTKTPSTEENPSSLEIPPATPSPVKKASTSSTSPTHTEPLSPDKDDNLEPLVEDKEFLPSTNQGKVCGFSRYLLIGSIVLIVAALVGIVVGVTSGGGSDSAASAENARTVPDSPVVNVPTQPSSPTMVSTPATNPAPAPLPATTATTSTDAPPSLSQPVPVTVPGTLAPSIHPTSYPTFALTTEAPTLIPTALATTAGPTTQAPTAAPSTAPTTVLSTLLPLLERISPRAYLEDPTTVQGQAAVWVAAFYNALVDTETTLLQRYAVAVLDRATNGGMPRVSDGMVDTCEWTGIACVNGTVTVLNWADSGLMGSIPNEIAALQDLQTLDLGENELTGPLPTGLFACSALEYLYLHQNRLTGALTENFANLPKLIRLYLGNNQFTGRLPQAFGSPNPLNARDMRPLRTFQTATGGQLTTF